MRVLVIENYPGTPLGLVGEALEERGIAIRTIAAHAGERVPEDIEDCRGLIVLGGEQSALADETHPFLPDVCTLIRRTHDQNKPILGICLGSQLIARALGGGNILGRPVEFGWHKVSATGEGREDPVVGKIGEGSPLFHWHSDTVELPAEAVHLASSQQTPIQAFRVGRTTYAIQFHFEASEAVVRDWTRTFQTSISQMRPDWPERLEDEVALNAAKSDQAGREIARAWAGLL
ncbi:type 1 glutamine amidotransferase [Roseibium sediminis]|uniref:type 1 glutamine amidotransferase n=1 Tax=Roseibium sediminis TaxID=1775174 RepID=UPI00123CBB5D|nr:type 1 glutamine amidotransferase [Roseibium sediminis]